MSFVVQTLAACAAAAIVVMSEAALVSLETLGASLIVVAMLCPSIVLFSALDWFRVRRCGVKGAVFVASLMPVMLGLLHASFFSREGRDVAQVFAVWYASGAIASYAALATMSWRRGRNRGS